METKPNAAAFDKVIIEEFIAARQRAREEQSLPARRYGGNSMPVMLGTDTTTNQPVILPAAARFEGLAVVGETGQGKSVMLSTSACPTLSKDMVSVSVIRTGS